MKSTGTHILYVSLFGFGHHLCLLQDPPQNVSQPAVSNQGKFCLCLVLLLMVLIQKLFRFYESLLFAASRWPDEFFVKCSATSFNSNSAASCSFPNWSHFHNLDTVPISLVPCSSCSRISCCFWCRNSCNF